MKIAISNIAWDINEEQEVSRVLKAFSIKGLEIAPTKVWEKPFEANDESLENYRIFWKNNGINIIAMQALLFNQSHLTVFENETIRLKTKEYLSKMITLGAKLGVKVLVFGSPKNRLVGIMDKIKAWNIAIEFFSYLGDIAYQHKVEFCIEPNPAEYGCDFIRTGLEGLELVKEVNNPGFRLHLDSGGMIMNKEDYGNTIEQSLPYLSHFHISEPYLQLAGQSQQEHLKIAGILKEVNYNNWVSIEMKNSLQEKNIIAVKEALEIISKIYG